MFDYQRLKVVTISRNSHTPSRFLQRKMGCGWYGYGWKQHLFGFHKSCFSKDTVNACKCPWYDVTHPGALSQSLPEGWRSQAEPVPLVQEQDLARSRPRYLMAATPAPLPNWQLPTVFTLSPKLARQMISVPPLVHNTSESCQIWFFNALPKTRTKKRHDPLLITSNYHITRDQPETNLALLVPSPRGCRLFQARPPIAPRRPPPGCRWWRWRCRCLRRRWSQHLQCCRPEVLGSIFRLGMGEIWAVAHLSI
jgi:hypothetical protein